MRTFPSRHAKRRRPHIAGGSPVWLFDLDNTLHHASHSIFPQINRAMTQYIIDTLQVDRDEANRMRVGYTERYGLIYTDFRNQKRTIKDSGYWYGRVAASNRLDA